MTAHLPGDDPTVQHKAAHKGKKNGQSAWFRPGFLLAASIFFWAALSQPIIFTINSASSWLLGTVTVGLLTKAVLVLIEPVMRLMISVTRAQLKNIGRDVPNP